MREFAIEKLPEFFAQIFPAITVTLTYVIWAFFLGLVFGFILALFKLSKNRILRAIGYGYTTVMRCTPSIVLLFLVYYGAPQISSHIFGVQMDMTGRVRFVIITLAMFCTASLSEVIRASYEAIDRDQLDAALSVGMTRPQTFVHVLIPQMMATAIPNLCNTILSLFKEGALAYTIGLYDLLGRGNYVIGRNLGGYAIEVYVILVAIYWCLSIIITRISGLIEKRFCYE